jgi:AcrR family transcriptional regulator
MVDARTLKSVVVQPAEPSGRASGPVSRHERKQRTRRALLDAALRLLADRSFASLSLREVTKEVGIVPTAFYRHFASLDELGVALVDESMRTLRGMLRTARRNPDTEADAIRASVRTLLTHVRAHEGHFRFLTRERYGGASPVQAAIATELRLFSSELAIDLGRFPYLREWSSEDLRVIADLIVTAMLATVMELVQGRAADPDSDAEIARVARKRLRMIVLGVPHWRSDRDDPH